MKKLTEDQTMTIDQKLSCIQIELKAKKSRHNNFGKYYYRSAEDILEALKPYNDKYGVHFTISEDLVEFGANGTIRTTAKITNAEGSNFVEAVAYAGIEKAGGMALPQAFGSASSYAKKYALGNLLLIDDTQDADAGSGTKKSSKKKLTDVSKAKAAIAEGKITLDKLKDTYELTDDQLKLF